MVTLGEAEEALEEAILLLLLLAGGLLGVGGRGLLVELGALGGDTTHAGTKTKAGLEARDDEGDNGILDSLGKNVLNGSSDHLGEHVDDGLKKTKLRSHGGDVAVGRVQEITHGGDVAAHCTNLATDGIDMLTNGVDVRLLSSSKRLLGISDVAQTVDMSTEVVDIDAKGTSSVKKSMLDHAEDLLQDSLHVAFSDTIATSVSVLLDNAANEVKDVSHSGTTSSEILLNNTVLNGMVDSMLDKAVEVGLSMKTLDHVLNAGADVSSLGALTTETITVSDGAGELNKEDSGLAHAVPLRAGCITTSLAETKEASVVIESGLNLVAGSGGRGELSVGAGLLKVTSHAHNHRGVDRMTINDDSDGGVGRGHVTSTVTLGGGSDRTVDHGAISDRGLHVNARVNRESRGLGRLVLSGGLGVDRKLGLSRSHCFGLVVDV